MMSAVVGIRPSVEDRGEYCAFVAVEEVGVFFVRFGFRVSSLDRNGGAGAGAVQMCLGKGIAGRWSRCGAGENLESLAGDEDRGQMVLV
jgi:hypothetical protein